jgi:hypothetical protein
MFPYLTRFPASSLSVGMILLLASCGCFAQENSSSGAGNTIPAPSPTVQSQGAVGKGEETTEQASPEDAAPQLARIILRDRTLTFETNNSSREQILTDVARLTGMVLSGLTNSPHVFGVYGPGNAREVLMDLLAGSGYNFVMVGGAPEGAPRELHLTPQAQSAPATSQNTARSNAASDPVDQFGPSAVGGSASDELGPGALPQTPSESTVDDNVRSERNIQRLQHIHQQQEQDVPQ